MIGEKQLVCLEVREFKVYYLRIFPLWTGDSECVEIGRSLEEIVAKILSEKSLSGLLNNEKKPMKFCQIEEEEAVCFVLSGQTFYGRERTPVWRVIVPKARLYSRETIISCISRNAGSNVEKYQNVLCDYPKTSYFFTYLNNEIKPVDDTIFVL